MQAPDKPTYVTLDFEKGRPVAIDGEKMKASDIIRKLNKLGGENGIGIIDIVENRLVGMKDRGVYETPGGTILYFAHEQLEMLCVDKDTLHEKQKLSVDFADLIYNGKWFTPLREALSAFVEKTQEYVTGTVKLKLYKGNIITAGVTLPAEPVHAHDESLGIEPLWLTEPLAGTGRAETHTETRRYGISLGPFGISKSQCPGGSGLPRAHEYPGWPRGPLPRGEQGKLK